MLRRFYSFINSEGFLSVEKAVAIGIFSYIPGLLVGCGLTFVMGRIGLPPQAGWILLALGSLYLFTYSKMSGKLAALSIAWTMTGMLMAFPIPLWTVPVCGLVTYFVVELLFKKTDIRSEEMPPVVAPPVSKEEFFKFAEQGVKTGKFFMGCKVGTDTPVWVDSSAMVEHMQTVGITRCGKTHFSMSLGFQGMIRGWTVIYVTGKPSATDWNIFWYLANRSGRAKDVKYFDPLDKTSDSLNPISQVGDQGTEMEMALQIMRAIGREPPASQDRSDAFYKDADLSRLLEVSALLTGLERPFTLKDCYLFFSDEVTLELMLREAEKKGLTNIVNTVAKMFEGLSGKKYDPLEGMTSRLRPWIAEPMNSKVNVANPDINIVDLISNGGLLYCALSPARMHAYANSLGRQIIAQVFGASEMLGSKNMDKPPILFILDEFQEYLAPFFNSMISQAGGREVCILLAHQDFSQLKRIEGIDKIAFSENIINNTSTKMFFSTRSGDDGEKMAVLFGTKRVIQKSRSVSVQPLGDMAFGGMSEREGEEFVIHPNWFKVGKKFLAACSSRTSSAVLRTTLFDIKNVRLSVREKQKGVEGGVTKPPAISREKVVAQIRVRSDQQRRMKHSERQTNFAKKTSEFYKAGDPSNDMPGPAAPGSGAAGNNTPPQVKGTAIPEVPGSVDKHGSGETSTSGNAGSRGNGLVE